MEKILIERRLFKRYDAPIKVIYRLSNGSAEGVSVTKNISMEGTRFQLPETSDIGAGTRLYIEIQIPEHNRTTVILGKIIWKKKLEPVVNNNYDIGIKFVRVDPFDIEDIINKAKREVEE